MKISPTYISYTNGEAVSVAYFLVKQVSGVSLHWFIITVVLLEKSPNSPAYQWLIKNYQ